jgi:hypothetical protein
MPLAVFWRSIQEESPNNLWFKYRGLDSDDIASVLMSTPPDGPGLSLDPPIGTTVNSDQAHNLFNHVLRAKHARVQAASGSLPHQSGANTAAEGRGGNQ